MQVDTFVAEVRREARCSEACTFHVRYSTRLLRHEIAHTQGQLGDGTPYRALAFDSEESMTPTMVQRYAYALKKDHAAAGMVQPIGG